MKKKFPLLFILVVLQFCSWAQGYRINVAITGFADNTAIVLKDFETQTDINNGVLINGRCTLEGKIEDGPRSLFLTIWYNNKTYYCTFLIKNEHITISGGINDFPNKMRITGSPIQDENNVLYKTLGPLLDKRESLMTIAIPLLSAKDSASKQKLNGLVKEVTVIDSLMIVERTIFFKAHSNSYPGLFQLYFLKEIYSKQEMAAYYNQLPAEMKESMLGRKVNTYVKVGAVLKKGDLAHDFTAADEKGQLHSINDFKGKYVLLDFMQTHCVPCVESVKELKTVHSTYADKLQVISFSADSKETWKKGLQRDKPEWLCLSDEKGKSSETSMKYGVDSFPTFVLIDPNGKIVDKWSGYSDGIITRSLSKFL